jgi:general secretion pathway protein G
MHTVGIRWQQAFTLLEVFVVLAVIGVLTAIAIPAFSSYKDRVLVAQAVNEITAMSYSISRYMDENRSMPPDSLDEVGMAGRLDPWGRPYQFTNLVGVKGKGSARKDKKLNPINSDYDLYSMGKDGDSKLPLTTKVSQDDVIRARDGRFIGLAKDFDP